MLGAHSKASRVTPLCALPWADSTRLSIVQRLFKGGGANADMQR